MEARLTRGGVYSGLGAEDLIRVMGGRCAMELSRLSAYGNNDVCMKVV